MEGKPMQLEAIHERAIELLVSGKRQNVVAKELDIGVRTLRRWAGDDTFIAELKSQRECATKLHAEQLAETTRLEHQILANGANKICELINDPKTPDNVRIQCLRISQSLLTQCTRREQAQEWREFVYFDKIAREEAKEAAEKKQRNLLQAIDDAERTINPSADLSCDALEAAEREKYRLEDEAEIAAEQAQLAKAAATPSLPSVPTAPSPRRGISIDPAAVADKVLDEMAARMKLNENRPKAAKTGQGDGAAAVLGAAVSGAGR
jgi:hypothetical protein